MLGGKNKMTEEILFADVILHELNDNNGAKVSELIELTGFNEEKVRKILKYLIQKKCVRMPLFITSISSNEPIPEGNYRLSTRGKEIIASGLSFTDIIKAELQGSSQTVNATNINGNQNQVAQTTGNNSPITQIQDNSKINVLKQLIADDKELDEPKKKKLFGILEKFNKLKESGENAYELIKQVGLIAARYAPLFFSLLD